MKELTYDTEDCICALATPWASSALAVVRLTGKGCIPAFEPFFSRAEVLSASPGGTVHHGYVRTASGDPLDEVVVTVWKAPRSYTGQDSLEISCHGSLAVLRRVLGELTHEAFRSAGPGEFTLRAFLNGKLDLTRAEAVQELVSAKTDSARSLALHRLGGSVENRVLELRRRLLDLSAVFNVQLDYAEDEVDTQEVPTGQLESLIRDLEALSGSYRTGRVLQEGLRVVLAGRTNAGKSSLFNLFLKEDRSIVSEEHGTTRDFIEAWVSLGEIPARLYDTAGLREADGLVEQEGIRRSRELLAGADLVFYLVDATDPVFEDLSVEESKLLRLWTKIDSLSAQPVPQGWIGVSSFTGSGLETILQQVKEKTLGLEVPAPGAPVIDSLRQKNLLDRAVAALGEVQRGMELGVPIDMAALDVHEALTALGEIVGEVTSADILNHMFGNFCVGK